jgi:hypothetical protein
MSDDTVNPIFPACYEEEGKRKFEELVNIAQRATVTPFKIHERAIIHVTNQVRRYYNILPDSTVELKITHIMAKIGTNGKSVYTPTKECLPHVHVYLSLQKNGKTITLPESIVTMYSLKPGDVILAEICGVKHAAN